MANDHDCLLIFITTSTTYFYPVTQLVQVKEKVQNSP